MTAPRRLLSMLLAGLGLMLAAERVGALTVDELPLSHGPYVTTLPDPALRTIEQVRNRLVLPPPASAPEEALAVRVGATVHWSALTGAIIASLSGGERWLFVFVRDPAGAERVMRFYLNARLMEPFLFPDGPTLSGNEDVLRVLPRGKRLVIEHEGKRVSPADVAGVLDTALSEVGDLFFPLHETPTKDEFPVWIESRGGGLRFDDIVETVSLVQTSGYPTALLDVF